MACRLALLSALLCARGAAVLEVRTSRQASRLPSFIKLRPIRNVQLPNFSAGGMVRGPVVRGWERRTSHIDPTICFPYNILPHWAPRPNASAVICDGALIVVAFLIFFPAYLTMRFFCSFSRPLDMLSTLYTLLLWAQANGKREARV
ncbi:MAG: hypothetical protein SGPRY_001885 [Prymnesium sp.]